MATNNHTPHTGNKPLDNIQLNKPLGELDTAIGSISPLSTKGDISIYSTTFDRLPVGTNGYVLSPATGEAEGLAWTPGLSYFAIFRDEKTTGTDGGSSATATWNIRALNTEVSDTRGLISLGSNLFTPQIAGQYYIEAFAPAFDCNEHKLKLYNATTLSDVLFGTVTREATTGNMQSIATLKGKFTANGTDGFGIRHYTDTAKTTTGLGKSVGDGAAEVYCEVFLQLINAS